MTKKVKIFDRLKKANNIEAVYKNGNVIISMDRKLKASHLSSESITNQIRIAVTVSSKAGSSVWRNRLKRIIRESLRLEKDILKEIVFKKKSELSIIFSQQQQETTTAYLQTHTLADTAGKILTIQRGVAMTTGTVKSYSALGCKVTAAEFSCEVGGMLTASFEVDGKKMDTAQALAAPSYPLMSPFHFGQMAVKMGTFGAEVALDGVRKVSVKVERGMAVDRFYAGAAGLKAEPITNDLVKVSGSIEADFTASTLADLFTSDAGQSLVWEFTGEGARFAAVHRAAAMSQPHHSPTRKRRVSA